MTHKVSMLAAVIERVEMTANSRVAVTFLDRRTNERLVFYAPLEMAGQYTVGREVSVEAVFNA